MKQILALLVAGMMATPAVSATPIPFDGNWQEQGFLRLFSNDYRAKGNRLEIESDGTVSLFWRAVPDGLRGATSARWAWSVEEGVPATDLRVKGGDDRNLALYFVFTDAQTAAGLDPTRAAKLLRDPNTRALIYVWGGDHTKGAVLPSPYHAGLRTIIRQTSRTGSARETVDLARDYRRAFGADAPVLVGIGVTADSDDTDTRIRAEISGLTLD